MFSNASSRTARERLTLKTSFDHGKTWAVEKVLTKGPAAYSDLVVLQDGWMGCLWEYPYSQILFAAYDHKWLLDAENKGEPKGP